MKKLVILLLAAAMLLSAAAMAEETARYDLAALGLPLSEEKVTLTFWWPQAKDLGELSSPGESELIQYLEEITNVHIEWIVPANGSEETAYQLLFTSDEMPDIVMQSRSPYLVYRNGQDAAIDDGYFVDLNDYLDCMPNYLAFLETQPSYKSMVVTDTGKREAIYQSFYRPCETESGIVIRKDLLDKAGLPLPVTYDDWHTVLTAFKEMGVYAPLYLMNNGATTYNEWSAGFGVAQGFYNEDGTVKFGAIQDSWKQYLMLMNQWYAEGLLDPDFMARTGTRTDKDTELLYSDNIGTWYDWTTRCDANYVQRGAQNPEFLALGVMPPKMNAGDVTHLRSNDICTSARYSVSATCEHPEIAVRWLDLFFCWDIAQDANYGMDDGRSFNYGEDGKRYLNSEFRYNNPEGVSSSAFFAKYGFKDPPLRIQDFQQDIFLPLQRASMENWTDPTALDDWDMPTNLTMTADEANTYNMVMADVTTYVNENAVQFITGAKSFDEWDAYVETIRGMGIDEVTTIEQAALDRYLNR